MNQILLTLELRGRRDVLLARHRARQLAGLLGFDLLDKLTLATAVFEMAWKAVRDPARPPLVFSLDENALIICAVPEARIQKTLPDTGEGLAPSDLPWAVRELERFDTFNVFEEARQQNQDLLALLHEVRQRRPRQEALVPGYSSPCVSAA